jgi:bifunctional DNase/RNase
MKQQFLYSLALLLSLYLSSASCASQNVTEEDLLEMRVKGVTVAPDSDTPIVVLEDLQKGQAFPIWIGLPEARAIVMEMEKIPTPRPLTHALLKDILATLQVEVTRIVIHDIQDNTFFALLVLHQGEKTLTVDARPSDAIALALQTQAPIFVSRKVLGAVRTVTLQDRETLQNYAETFGMRVQSLDAKLAGLFHVSSTDGVLVAAVKADSQAERLGVHRGDVITRIDGQPVRGVQDFLAVCQNKKVGQEIVLQVTRNQHPLELRVQLSTLD